MSRSRIKARPDDVARSLLFAAGLSAAALGWGCAPTVPPARVEQGEAISTGDSSYDDFFKQVQEARAQVDQAKKDVDEARATLAKALELSPKEATFESILSETEERAKKLRERGVVMHLEITPEAKLVTTGKALDPWGEDVVRGIEGSSKKWLALARKMIELSSRAAALQKTRLELREGASSALGPRSSDVVRELDASESVIDSTASSGLKQAGVASRFLIAVADAIEPEGAKPKASPRPGASSKGGGRPQGKAQGSSGGAAPPPPPPKPKPKSDDFEP